MNKEEIARELWKCINKRREEIVDYKQSLDGEKLKKLPDNHCFDKIKVCKKFL